MSQSDLRQRRPLRHQRRPFRQRRQGFSLIDVLVIIVLLGLVAGTMTTVFSQMAVQTAAAVKQRQLLAAAYSLLDEIRAKPFTYCDPNDANVSTAANSTGCAALVDAMGPEPGESRYNPGARFDGVTDYQGFVMPGPGCAGVCDMAGNLINVPGSVLVGCSQRVTLAPLALPGIAANDAQGRPQALRIIVTLACPGVADTVVEGVRVRHSPNSV